MTDAPIGRANNTVPVAATPIFDEIADSLAHKPGQPADTIESDSPVEALIPRELSHTIIDPDTPQGAAIVVLFRWIKRVEHADGSWHPDVIHELTNWFDDLGIDVVQDPDTIERTLRLAARTRTGHPTRAGEYHILLRTDMPPSPDLLREAMRTLVTTVGQGTSAWLSNADGDRLAQFVNPLLGVDGQPLP